jgi:hypothetical protein
MQDKDLDTGDSWSIAFFTTSVCFFTFIFFLRIIDNSFPHFFLWIGIASLFLGCLSLVNSIWLKRKI